MSDYIIPASLAIISLTCPPSLSPDTDKRWRSLRQHGAPSASPNTAFVTPCTAPLHASRNLRAPLLIRVRGARGKSCAAIKSRRSTPAARAGAGADQEERIAIDAYSIVSERIIEKLEAGTIPWHKPWRSIGVPQNLVSKKMLSRD